MFKDLTPEEKKEHQQFIKESVDDGSYFNDALDWYIFRYVQPICERTILFFTAIITGITCYSLILIMRDSLPIVQKVPIVIQAKDPSLYFPVIKKLRDSESLRTIDEAVVKYLLVKYLRQREEYDFRDADIEDLNLKFAYIKNNSSPEEYRSFQAFMSKDNAASPIINFGKNVTRLVSIESVVFLKGEQENLANKTKNLIVLDVPKEVEIRYHDILSENGVVSEKKYLTKIAFNFSGVWQKNKKETISQKKLDFTVISYKTYIIK